MKEAQFGSSPDLLTKVHVFAWERAGDACACVRPARSCMCPPTGGAIEAARSAVEGSVCLGASDLIGIGAIDSAEEAPTSPVSSLADLFAISSSPLDTSTSILIF
jgi:hypothetical protein